MHLFDMFLERRLEGDVAEIPGDGQNQLHDIRRTQLDEFRGLYRDESASGQYFRTARVERVARC